jgi:glycerol-3-phosphate dehydrogenase (NAD(P)+)
MSMMTQPIAVIGAGAWGTALALLLASNGNAVRLWGNEPAHQQKMIVDRENHRYLPGFVFPDNLQVMMTLSEALDGVKDILVVVPSHAFRQVVQEIKTYVEEPRLAWGTKGLDPDHQQLLHRVVAEIFSEQTPIAVLSGPSFAKEVAAGKPTAVSLAGNDAAFSHDMIKRFHNPNFRVYENSDLVGLQLCGTLKNILAIAVGIADGMELGANTRAALMTRGLVEMQRLCQVMGAQQETLMSLAGIGDLVLTCTDDQSRNRRFGKAIGQGKSCEAAEKQIGQAVEGLHNVKQVEALAAQYRVEMPITHQVHQILFASLDPKVAMMALLSRPVKTE